MSNEVYDIHGKLIGFECRTCGRIYTSGWGDNCPKCDLEQLKVFWQRKQDWDMVKLVSDKI